MPAHTTGNTFTVKQHDERTITVSMQQITLCQQGTLHHECSIQKASQALQDEQAVIWLDIQSGEDWLQKYAPILLHDFNLSPLTINTLQENKERAKLLHQHHYFYLVTHGLDFDADKIEAATPKLDIIFGKNFLITIHQGPMPWLDDILQAIREDESEDNIMRMGLPLLLHAVLDNLVDSYIPILNELDEQIDILEDATVQQATNEVQTRIFRMKRVLAHMRRVISPQVEVSNSLITRTGDYIPTEIEPYFVDVHDHLIHAFEILDSYRDLMSSLLDVYLTTVSNRQNEIMKQLALIATIFLPITFITGVFGQNFGRLPQVVYDRGYDFWIVLAAMALISLVQIWYFRRRKWL
jgi:magnesium transporter